MSAIHPVPAAQSFTPTVWAFVARVMKPVIRIFLRLGFSAEQISQMVRKLCVDVAMEHEEFRPPNRKRAFIAHAAVVTGLSRKEVSKLNDMDGLGQALDTRQVNRSVRVLAGWMNDRRYRDMAGKPLATLPIKSAEGVSFHQLVREYGGDIPPRSILDALIQRGAIARRGKVVALAHDYPTQAVGQDEEMEFIGIMLGDALDTAEFDLRPDSPDRRLFREWYQVYVPADRVTEAEAVLREEILAFGRAMEERLADLAHRGPKANTEYRRVGLGAYYFETEELGKED